MSRRDHQYEAEHTSPSRPSAIAYLTVLFTVAFLLLLMAYFQQRRANEAAREDFHQSVSSFQSIEQLLEDNQALREQLSVSQTGETGLEQENEALRRELGELKTQLSVKDAEITKLQIKLAAQTETPEP